MPVHDHRFDGVAVDDVARRMKDSAGAPQNGSSTRSPGRTRANDAVTKASAASIVVEPLYALSATRYLRGDRPVTKALELDAGPRLAQQLRRAAAGYYSSYHNFLASHKHSQVFLRVSEPHRAGERVQDAAERLEEGRVVGVHEARASSRGLDA